MGVKSLCLQFAFIFAIFTLGFIFRKSLDEFYAFHVPKIEMFIHDFVGALYQFEENISILIIRSILLGADVDYSNIIQTFRQLCLRLFFYIQISRLLIYEFGTLRRFWSPELVATNQATQNEANPPDQSDSTPTCKGHLFPKEFHWLLFDNDEPHDSRTLNGSHQKIIELFDIAKASNQQRSKSSSEHQNCSLINDALNTTCLDGSLENEYTGWSKEILGLKTPGNRQDSETHKGTTSHNVDSVQGAQTVNCKHCGCSRTLLPVRLSENEPRIEPSPSSIDSVRVARQSLEQPPSAAAPELANPYLLIFDLAGEARSEQGPVEVEPVPEGAGPAEGRGGFGMGWKGNVFRSSSSPVLCTLCPRPERRFAMGSVAELMPVCCKLVAPCERWPRTTYTLVNVKPAVD